MSYPSRSVFLSYSHADEEAAIRIYGDLKAAGFDPWLDKFSLAPGAPWKPAIDRAIRHCGAFLSLISHNSLDRGGILAGEMKLALDLRAQRLDDGGILIPVRLEHCDVPAELRHLQALNLYAPDGPANLNAALSPLLRTPTLRERLTEFSGRRSGKITVALLCVVAGMGVYRAISTARRLPYEHFLLSRPGSPAPPPPDTAPQIGITVWRVTEDNAAGSGVCGFLRFTRQPLDTPVHTKDKLRFDVQASRPGFIYVISREIDSAGHPGPPELLFPVTSVNKGDNRIAPGDALLIPPALNECRTLSLDHAGAAEKVSVIFSATPIESLPASSGPYNIDPAVEAALLASASPSTLTGGPRAVDSRGIELPDSESRHLDYTSSGPDVVFTSGRTTGPTIATFTLKTQK